jgi:hypothetical protein
VSDARRRGALIVLILVVLVGVALTGSGAGAGPPTGTNGGGRSAAVADDVAAPAAAESSAWFCAGGTGDTGGAPATIVLTNPTARTVRGTLTAVPSDGQARSVPVSVPAHAQTGVVPSQVASGAVLAAAVVLDGGGVVVSQAVSGFFGSTLASCASATASHWYFADGSTAPGDTLSLALFNPASTTAVVDVSLVSPTAGLSTPPVFQGIDVPGQSLTVENVGDQALDDPALATEVTTLSGSVVAAELQTSGQAGDSETSIEPGVTSAASTWSFAQNTDVTGGSDVFHILNPSSRPVAVTFRLALAQGRAEPLSIRVAAQSAVSLVAQNETRIPAGVAYAVTFTSSGAGIVVGRHVSAPAGAQAPQQGDVVGVPGGADHWLLPATATLGAGVSSLAVVDLAHRAVTVTDASFAHGRLTPVAGLARRRVAVGTPLFLGPDPAPAVGTEPTVVLSSGPVAVELDTLPAGSPGIVVMPAFALR